VNSICCTRALILVCLLPRLPTSALFPYTTLFRSNANGENVHYDNLEVTRLVRELEPHYVSVLPSTPMRGEERREFAEYQKMVTYYANKTQEAHFGQVSYTGLKRVVDTMVSRIGKENPTLADFDNYKAAGDLEKMAL